MATTKKTKKSRSSVKVQDLSTKKNVRGGKTVKIEYKPQDNKTGSLLSKS